MRIWNLLTSRPPALCAAPGDATSKIGYILPFTWTKQGRDPQYIYLTFFERPPSQHRLVYSKQTRTVTVTMLTRLNTVNTSELPRWKKVWTYIYKITLLILLPRKNTRRRFVLRTSHKPSRARGFHSTWQLNLSWNILASTSLFVFTDTPLKKMHCVDHFKIALATLTSSKTETSQPAINCTTFRQPVLSQCSG